MKKAVNGEEKRSKKEIVIEVDMRRLGFMALTFLMCILALLTLFKFVCGFLKIKEFSVEGKSDYYRTAQLVAASGLNYGDLLYSADISEAEKLILENCTYMEDVEIRRVFPNKIIFEVEEKEPQWYIEISGDYYALNADLTVLQESSSEEIFKSRGLTGLTLPNIKSAVCGELPSFGADDREIKYTCELINDIHKHSMKPRLTFVDIANRFEIYITVDGNYRAYFGDRNNIKSKLDALEKILTPEFCEKYRSAEIDVSNPATVGVTPN